MHAPKRGILYERGCEQYRSFDRFVELRRSWWGRSGLRWSTILPVRGAESGTHQSIIRSGVTSATIPTDIGGASPRRGLRVTTLVLREEAANLVRTW
jgi:hypothetical protein